MSPDFWPRALGFLDGWKRSHHHKHGCPKRTLAVFSHDPKVTGGRESATLPQFSHLANGNSNASLGSMRVVNKSSRGRRGRATPARGAWKAVL